MSSIDIARHSTAASLIWRLSGPEDTDCWQGAAEPGSLERDLLARLHLSPPMFFEKVAIDLLKSLGYGQHVTHVGGPGDGGIDGLVAHDGLGLQAVYFQAKRYAPEAIIPVSEIRDFAGSLDVKRAAAGVFVTTARISRAGDDFARLFSRKLILICGTALAKLLVEHQLGVRTRTLLQRTEIDDDYFAGMTAADMISASIQPRK